MKSYGPHRLMCVNAWLRKSDTIRRCGLVGVDVGLVGGSVSLKGWALRSPMFKLHTTWYEVSFCCLPIKIYNSTQLFLQNHVCLDAALLSTMMIMNKPLKL